MKKIYETAKLEPIHMGDYDVITLSGDGDDISGSGGDINSELPFVPAE